MADAEPTFSGRLDAIYLTAEAGAPLRPVPEVVAVEGRGLEGDRYFVAGGTYSDQPGEGRQVTLIERESVEAVLAEEGIALSPADLRRNLVTVGVPLNHLVGHDFRVGGVSLRGIRLCEPCGYLQRLLAVKGLASLFLHRGGLRADVVLGGVMRSGDVISPG